MRAQNRKGQLNVGTLIGIVIFIVMIVVVAIPLTNSAISDANLTGTTKTVVEQIPIFLAIAGLVAATVFFSSRR